MADLKRTPFYEFHVKAGAKMVDFAGWEMPLLYRGILEEHQHTRTAASIFDVSHMGRLKFTGKGAEGFLQKVCTRNVGKATGGQSMYSLVCNESGGILDDVIVSRFAEGAGHWMMVCNASNREKLLGWFAKINAQTSTHGPCEIEDETEKTGMVAIQGPKAVQLLDDVLPEPVSDIGRYHFEVMRYLMFIQFTVFRSGYTGEDGAEIVCGTTAAGMAMKYLLKSDREEHAILKPAGLGARDTLRLEAGMPLYGHELTEQRDPLSAGLGWAVDLSKEFIGAEALRKVKADGAREKLVGLLVEGPRSARAGMVVLQQGRAVGVITSGAMSPTLKRPIAMAYVPAESAAPGTALQISANALTLEAITTALPFYRHPK